MVYLMIIIGCYVAIDHRRIAVQVRQRNFEIVVPAAFLLLTLVAFYLKMSSLSPDLSATGAFSAFISIDLAELAESMEKALALFRFTVFYVVGFALFFVAVIFLTKDKSLKRGVVNSLIMLFILLAISIVGFL